MTEGDRNSAENPQCRDAAATVDFRFASASTKTFFLFALALSLPDFYHGESTSASEEKTTAAASASLPPTTMDHLHMLTPHRDEFRPHLRCRLGFPQLGDRKQLPPNGADEESQSVVARIRSESLQGDGERRRGNGRKRRERRRG